MLRNFANQQDLPDALHINQRSSSENLEDVNSTKKLEQKEITEVRIIGYDESESFLSYRA